MIDQKVIVPLIGLTTCIYSWAGPDLTVRHIGTSSLNKDVYSFTMGLEVRNVGDAAYTGPVKLKPFIIPQMNPANVNGFKAIQFDTSIAFVNIPAGESQIVTYYTNELPSIPNSLYYIGATIVADREVNPNNNMTNALMPIGNLSNSADSPLDTAIDIYSDVRNQVNPVNGRAQHPWRLFWRGDRKGVIRVLFSVLDPSKMYVYPSTYEKDVGWVNMGRDYDERGRVVNFDVYIQGPEYNTAAPGDLFLLTLSNYTENAFEFDHSNNLDARKFHASFISPNPSLEVWKTYVEENPNPFHETVQLNSTYRVVKNWELDRGTLPAGLNASIDSGNTGASVQLSFNYENWEVDYGVHKFSGLIKVKDQDLKIEEKKVNFVISKYVGGTQPVIEVANSVQVSAVSPAAPAPLTYMISNPGQSPLSYKIVKNNDWFFLSSTEGTIPAGGTQNITITFSPIGRDLGNSVGSFVIHNNSVDSLKTISVTYTDNAPTSAY